MSELIRTYYLNALLADAAYAKNLVDRAEGGDNFNEALVLDGRFDRVVAPNHNKETALTIEKNYEFITQSDESTNFLDIGFSAMLVKSKPQNTLSSEYVIAVRGTESDSNADKYQDIFSTDVGDIGIEGLAVKQAIEMFNWYSIISTPLGESAVQLKYYDSVYSAFLDETEIVSTTYGGLENRKTNSGGQNSGGQILTRYR